MMANFGKIFLRNASILGHVDMAVGGKGGVCGQRKQLEKRS